MTGARRKAVGIGPATVRRVVRTVLDAEAVGDAHISVTFLSTARMRALNRRGLGHDHPTDVVAYGLPHAGGIAGDVYICPAVARISARDLGITVREELMRLVVHGTLHVLGYDHPSDRRTASAMWRRQERHLRALVRHPVRSR